LAATGFGSGRLHQRSQVLLKGILFSGFGDEGGDGSKRLGHQELRRSDFDGQMIGYFS
jgi:hypothetical protein